ELYLARACRVRVIEVTRLARVSVVTAVVVHAAERPLGLDVSVQRSIAAGLTMWVALSLSRGLYSSWLRDRRARGHDTRPVVILGTNGEARSLQRLLLDNPEHGLRPVAVIDPGEDVMLALRHHGSDSVVVAASAAGTPEVNRLTRRLLDLGVHVHLSSGLSGIGHRRLRAQPLAREPLFYVEPLAVSPWQLVVKRTVDIIGGIAAVALAGPVLLVAGVAIKLDSTGPVLYRQQRVGRDGRLFWVYKLRTMIPGADRQLHLVQADNQRSGPLFKSHSDPRVTRVGRILRATSIDELPQLFNVLGGTMSLVGPRPALAHEVEQFDDEHLDRTRVRPGMTGLWQIEGRDKPSFDVYRRLDLYYIDNWSLMLDLVILLATGKAVLFQAVGELRRCRKSAAVPVADAGPTVIDLTPNRLDAGVSNVSLIVEDVS
ncbi:MAG: sugar transferase, partial [Acidimicrobiales bacterium]